MQNVGFLMTRLIFFSLTCPINPANVCVPILRTPLVQNDQPGACFGVSFSDVSPYVCSFITHATASVIFVAVVVHKHLLADQSQILHGACMGRVSESLFAAYVSHDQLASFSPVPNINKKIIEYESLLTENSALRSQAF